MSRTAVPRLALYWSSRASYSAHIRAIEPSCRNIFILHSSAPRYVPNAARTFSSGLVLCKKAGKANKSHARTDSSPPISKAGQLTPTDEALDASGLETQILKAMEKLTHDLSQLRAGGRLNPEVVEGLKVQLGVAGKEGTGRETVKLGDIAQVIPRGRVLHVMVGEADHIKPISSAIASSPHNLTPLTPESSSPLTIQVPLPPPTGETRRAAIESASKAAEQADKWIQTARATKNKELRKYQLNKSVLPDDLQKASKMMEEVVKKGHAEVKRIADAAKRVLESQ